MENKGKKVVKVPEAGQWPDKVALPALVAGTVLTTAGFLMAFLYAAPVNGAASVSRQASALQPATCMCPSK